MRLIFITIIILLVGFWSVRRSDPQTGEIVAPTGEQAQTFKPKNIDVDGSAWAYDIIEVESNDKPTLLANYGDKINSEELMDKHSCKMGVNAGFYLENFLPVGGVIIKGAAVREHSRNSLFNGYMGLEREGGKIDYGWDENLQSVVQTGPILMYEGKLVKLALARDKEARRMVGATTAEGKIVFLTVFRADTVLDGPLLEQLPGVIERINELEKLEISEAINLDGGAASAWYSSTLSLPEWQPVGSWWCVS